MERNRVAQSLVPATVESIHEKHRDTVARLAARGMRRIILIRSYRYCSVAVKGGTIVVTNLPQMMTALQLATIATGWEFDVINDAMITPKI